MKALTLWQPWASLVALGHKRVETRCWSTKYRGPLAIHAAAKKPNWLGVSAESESFRREISKLKIDERTLPCGVVLCTVGLVSVMQTSEDVVDDLSEQEYIFGNYEEGRYAWFFENLKTFPVPIRAKGNRMLWNWNQTESARK